MPAIQVSQCGVRQPSASIIARMILGCRSIIFRVASMEEVSHPFSSVFSHIIMVQKNVLKLSIMDNESKFHTKMLVTHMESHGIQIYPGSGKKPWDRSENVALPEATIVCKMRQNLQRHSKMHRKTWSGGKRIETSGEPWWCGIAHLITSGKPGLLKQLEKLLIDSLKSCARLLKLVAV